MTRLSGHGEIPNNLPISTTNFTPTTNALGIDLVRNGSDDWSGSTQHRDAVAPDERFVMRTISRMSEI
jgi:hypothetical protein